MSERILGELESHFARDGRDLDVNESRAAQYEVHVHGYGEAVLVLDLGEHGQLLDKKTTSSMSRNQELIRERAWTAAPHLD